MFVNKNNEVFLQEFNLSPVKSDLGKIIHVDEHSIMQSQSQKIRQYFVNEGLLSLKGKPTEKLQKLKFPPLSPTMVIDLHHELHKEFDIFINSYWIRFSISQLIYDYTVSFRYFPIKFFKLVGSYVVDFLISKNPEYLKKIFELNELKFPEEFYKNISTPKPNDIDIRLEIDQFVEKKDIEDLMTWISHNIAYNHSPQYITKDENFRVVYPQIILSQLPAILSCKPFDNGINKFLIVNFKDSPIETVFSFSLARQGAFLVDDLYIPIEKLIFSPDLPVDEIKKIEIIPQSHSNSGVYGLLLHLIKKIEVIDEKSLDYKNWFRLVHWYSKGYSSTEKGFEKRLFNVLDKVCNLKDASEDLKSIQVWIKEFETYAEKHAEDPCEKLVFFINALSFLNSHLPSNLLNEVCFSVKRYFLSVFKDFAVKTPDEEIITLFYELLFIHQISFKTFNQLLQIFCFLSFTSNQSDIDLIDHEGLETYYQKKLTLSSDRIVFINTGVSDVKILNESLEDMIKVERINIKLFILFHKEANYSYNILRMKKFNEVQPHPIHESIYNFINYPNSFINLLYNLIRIRDNDGEMYIKQHFFEFIESSILKTIALKFISENILSDSYEHLAKLSHNDIFIKLANTLCFSKSLKDRNFGTYLLTQAGLNENNSTFLHNFIALLDEKFSENIESSIKIILDLYLKNAITFQKFFFYYIRFCQEFQKQIKDRELKSFTSFELNVFTSLIDRVIKEIKTVETSKKNYTCFIWSVKRLVEEGLVEKAEELLVLAQDLGKIPFKSAEISMGWKLILMEKLKQKEKISTLLLTWKHRIERGEILPEINNFVHELFTKIKNESLKEDLFKLFDFMNAYKIVLTNEFQCDFKEELLSYYQEKVKNKNFSSQNSVYQSLTTQSRLEINLDLFYIEISENNFIKAYEILNELFAYKSHFTNEFELKFQSAFDALKIEKNILALRSIETKKHNMECFAYQIKYLIKKGLINETKFLLNEAETHGKIVKCPEITESYLFFYKAKLIQKEKASTLLSWWSEKLEKQEIISIFDPLLIDLYMVFENSKEDVQQCFEFILKFKIEIPKEFQSFLQNGLINHYHKLIESKKNLPNDDLFKMLTVTSKMEVELFLLELFIKERDYVNAEKILNNHLSLSKLFTLEIKQKYISAFIIYMKNYSSISEASLESSVKLFHIARKLKIFDVKNEVLLIIDLLKVLQNIYRLKLENNLFDLLIDNYATLFEEYQNATEFKTSYKVVLENFASAFVTTLEKHPVIEISPFAINKKKIQTILSQLFTELHQTKISKEIINQLQLKYSLLPTDETFVNAWILTVQSALKTQDLNFAINIWTLAKKNNFHLDQNLATKVFEIINELIDLWSKDVSEYPNILKEISYVNELTLNKSLLDDLKNNLLNFYKKSKNEIPLFDRLNLLEIMYNFNKNETQNLEIITFANEVFSSISEQKGFGKCIEILCKSSFIIKWPEKKLTELISKKVKGLTELSVAYSLLSFEPINDEKNRKKEFCDPCLAAFELMKAFPKNITIEYEKIWYDLCERFYYSKMSQLWDAVCYLKSCFQLSVDADVSLWLKVIAHQQGNPQQLLLEIWIHKQYSAILPELSPQESKEFHSNLYMGLIALDLKTKALRKISGLKEQLLKEIQHFISSLIPVAYGNILVDPSTIIKKFRDDGRILYYYTADMSELDDIEIISVFENNRAKICLEGDEVILGRLTSELIGYKLNFSEDRKEGYEQLIAFMKEPHSLKVWSQAGIIIHSLQHNPKLDDNNYLQKLLSLSSFTFYNNLQYSQTINYLIDKCSEWSLNQAVQLVKIGLFLSKFESSEECWFQICKINDQLFAIDDLSNQWVKKTITNVLEIIKINKNKFTFKNFEIESKLHVLKATVKWPFIFVASHHIKLFNYTLKFIQEYKFSEQQLITLIDLLSQLFYNLQLGDESIATEILSTCFPLVIQSISICNLRVEKKIELLNSLLGKILLVNELNLLNSQNSLYQITMWSILPGFELLSSFKVKAGDVIEPFTIYTYLMYECCPNPLTIQRFHLILESNEHLLKQIRNTNTKKNKSPKESNKKTNKDSVPINRVVTAENNLLIFISFMTQLLREGTKDSLIKAMKYISKNEKRLIKTEKLMSCYQLLLGSVIRLPSNEKSSYIFFVLESLMFSELELGSLIESEIKICCEVRQLFMISVQKKIVERTSDDLIKAIDNDQELRSLIKVLALILYKNLTLKLFKNRMSQFFEDFKKCLILIDLLCHSLKDINQLAPKENFQSQHGNRAIVFSLDDQFVEINNQTILEQATNLISLNDISLWQTHELYRVYCEKISMQDPTTIATMYFNGFTM